MHRMFSRMLSAVSAALLLLQSGLTASAVNLPDGAVKGLPSALTVMDDSGNAVPEDGEYFFEVLNMQPHTDYTKEIEIMNLRDDKSYHIYFYAEPVSHAGEIDLYDDCEAVFTLDGEEIFSGDVNGKPDDGGATMKESPIDLGEYAPGESRKLTCTVRWEGESADLVVDYGKKLVTKDGTYIIEEGSGDNYIYGEVYFRWVFCAAIIDPTDSTSSEPSDSDSSSLDSEPSDSSSLDSEPSDSSSLDSEPSDSSCLDSEPSDSTSSEPTPTDSVPTDSIPSDSTPSDSTPSDSTPTDSMSSDSLPPTPTTSTPSNSTPTSSTSGTKTNDKVPQTGVIGVYGTGGLLLILIIVFKILIYKKEKKQKQGDGHA